MVISLAAIGGVVIGLADHQLHRGLPRVTMAPGASAAVAYRVLTDVGRHLVPCCAGGYFTTESASFRPPVEVGVALLIVGRATITWWVVRVRDGIGRPPLALMALGRGALLTAVVLGDVNEGSEVSAILYRTAS